jgi:MSHA biogenesis protein MshJ
VKLLWQRYAARFDALSLRERVMVFAAVMVAALALAYTLMLEPQLAKQKRLSGALLQKHSEMRAFEAQATKLLVGRGPGADRASRERVMDLRAELAGLEARIIAEERKFTAPSEMRAVIERLLDRNRNVALVEMRTLPADTLASATQSKGKAAAKPAAGERLIYRHGVELTVSGSYLDLLAYARDLERLPRQLYWAGLQLDAAGHPKVSMKLTVYTLSLDRTWLSV